MPICDSCCDMAAISVARAGGVGGRFFMFLARIFRLATTLLQLVRGLDPRMNPTLSDSSPPSSSSSSVDIGLCTLPRLPSLGCVKSRDKC